jgi:signal transduction histidine kinase
VLLGRLRIRVKVSLLATIPLVAVLVLTVAIVVNRAGVISRAEESARAVRAANSVSTLLGELQQERLQMIGFLLRVVDRSKLIRQGAVVTDRISDMRLRLGDDISPGLEQALDAADRLRSLRAEALAGKAAPTHILDAYSAVNTGLIDALHLADRADLDTPAGRQVTALDMVLRLDEVVNHGATLIAFAVATKSADASTGIAVAVSTALSLGNDLGKVATQDQFQVLTVLLQAFNSRVGGDFYLTFSTNPAAVIDKLSLATLFPALESFVSLGRFVERKISTDAIAEIDQERGAVLFAASGLAAASLLVLFLVVVLSIIVARAVVGPLTRLTQLTLSADRVAALTEAELVRVADDESEAFDPVRIDPIEVPTTDEIGDLARAFERVRGTAVRLVERQVLSRRHVAQMFGHVGRRTQNLVGRQVAMIDRLERDETDPRRLEQLYRLDHVSSRLRRNAGSLVVLSGGTGAEEHSAPLPMADVVRLALGEIEDYARVDVSVPPEYAVAPAIIADLVLLLAELMENATAFSPPYTRVSVSMDNTGRGVRVSVVDHGIGLTEERIAEENNRISHRERLDLVPTEVLGLFVVGRLARRHGLRVWLAPTPGGGITASVDIGPHRLVSGPAMASSGGNALTSGSRAKYRQVPSRPHAGAATTEDDHAGAGRPGTPNRVGPMPPAAGATAGSPPIDKAVARAAADAGRPAGVDVAALDRASRILSTGRSWNAFALPRESGAPALPAAPAGPQPQAAAPLASDNGDRPAAARPGGLRRRVPGAQVPVGVSPQPPARTPALDPATARALVEDFESGVRRAQAGDGPAPRATVPQPAASETVAPVTSPRMQPTPAPPAAMTPGRPSVPARQLVRRVPGATLDPDPPRQQSPSGTGLGGQAPPDPDAARALIEQFEEGVSRAMRDIESERRDDKGSRE